MKKTLTATVVINSLTSSHVGFALSEPFRCDIVNLSGDVDSFLVTDILVDGVSQLIRDIDPPEGASDVERKIWRTLNLLLGSQLSFNWPAAMFAENPFRLKLDTARESIVVVVKNISVETAMLTAHFEER